MIRSQTCAKYIHEEDQKEANRQNEDAFCIYNSDSKSDKNLKIALSDGAGGMGLFAADWSKQLVDNLPNEPFENVESVSNWLGTFWEQFYDRYSQKAAKLGSDYQNKFFEQGSAATLVGLWEKETVFEWVTYGDSCISVFSKSSIDNTFQMFPYSLPSQFSTYPHLINVQEECQQEGFLKGSFEKENVDFILLTSDALSLYILLRVWQTEKKEEFKKLTLENSKIGHLANKINELEEVISANDFLENLWKITESKESFEKWCYEKHKSGVLENDDYTCVIVKL
ncbi:hypothetical protein WAF17_14675 [Bernardetia sp. ABR2-2B]|uniref:hypothetical protein n=1 Tax=Bernardetia sp. ABR2-2B TaxID=3127472 RepID=UPI0030D53B56